MPPGSWPFNSRASKILRALSFTSEEANREESLLWSILGMVFVSWSEPQQDALEAHHDFETTVLA